MNNNITKCSNIECPLKSECWRGSVPVGTDQKYEFYPGGADCPGWWKYIFNKDEPKKDEAVQNS